MNKPKKEKKLLKLSVISFTSVISLNIYAYSNYQNPPVVNLSHDLNSQQVASADLAPPQQSDYQQNPYQSNSTSQYNYSDDSGTNIPSQQTNTNQYDSGQNNVDYQPAPSSDAGLTNLPPAERLIRVEQQVQNLVNMGMPQEISQLQQQVQQLTGEIEQQQHELALLQKQLKQQTQQLKVSTPGNSAKSPADASVSAAEDELSDEDQAYQNALLLLNKKQYQTAAVAFKKYLKNYPQGKFAANAHYWLGELYSVEGDLSSASSEFAVVISKYPNGDKAADAQLKLAMIHVQQGQTSSARLELQQIQKQFPGSAAAHLAEIQLQQLNLSN